MDRGMTRKQALEWGAQENAARVADIIIVSMGSMRIDEAHRRARARAKSAGMRPLEVFRATVEAQRSAAAVQRRDSSLSWRPRPSPTGRSSQATRSAHEQP